MSAIGKIRERSTLLVAIIGIALAAFILGDLVKGTGGGGEEEYTIGEIYGEPISEEKSRLYEQRVSLSIDNYRNQGAVLDAQTRHQIHESEWNRIKREIIIGHEAELLGLTVTKEELTEIVHGDSAFVHRFIKNDPTFIDSATGKFSSRLVTSFIQRVSQDENMKSRWEDFLRVVKADRLHTKYYNLVKQGMYITNFEATKQHQAAVDTRQIKFVVKKYNDIPADEIKLDDDAIYSYYEAHKDEKQYEQQASRVIEYAMITMDFSDEDLEKTRSFIEGKRNRFARSTNDSLFVVSNSATKAYNPNELIRKGQLDPEQDALLFGSDTAVIVGPYRDGNFFKIAKRVSIDTLPESRARHILIPYTGALRAEATITRTKEQAKALADSLLKEMKSDTSKFAMLATSFSSDKGSAAQGGDLGWFGEGMMVTAFNDFCFGTAPGGTGLVETEYGYHIIEVTGRRDLAAKVVSVAAEIKTLERTIKQYREKAIDFIAAARKSKTSLTELSGEYQFPVKEIEFRDEDFTLNGIDNSADVLSWARSAMKNDISDPILNGNALLVVRLKKIKMKGVPDFEDVKEIMRIPTEKHLKALAYEKKMTGSSLDEVASRVQGQILDASLRFADFTIPGGGGNEPKVIGAIFANHKDGDIIGPIEGNVGIYTVLIVGNTPGEKTTDLSVIKQGLYRNNNAGAENAIYNALEKIANVVDKRTER